MEQANFIAKFALWAWAPIGVGLCALLGPRRGVVATFIAGWLLLPMLFVPLPALPDYSKFVACSLGALAGALLLDAGRVMRFRPAFFDGPVLVWCVTPLATSLSNGLGAQDGLSGVITNIFQWGVPWFLGRVYFTDLDAARDLAKGVLFGGLAMIPLALWEVRMSPQLHVQLYGFRQHPDWQQALRFGGYRPMIFLQHGLAVGLYMCGAAVVAYALWRSRALRSIAGVPMSAIVAAAAGTALACKSLTAIALGAIAIAALGVMRLTRVGALVWVLVFLPPAYIGARTLGGWSGQGMIALAEMISADRAGSLRTRFHSEDVLWARASQRPMFGWGAGRSIGVDPETGQLVAIPDGYWIIVAGRHGLVGLFSMMLVCLLPAWMLLRRAPARDWLHPHVAPAAALALLPVLFMCDSLLNAMLNPLFILAAGATASVARLGLVPRRERLRMAAA